MDAMRDDDPDFPPFAGDEVEERRETPDVLPPVEPPSAGFIVQLFLIPALIVAVVVGVYLLFGQLASGEVDWRRQVDNVRSQNPHVRWRGALALAQMLDADAQSSGTEERLAENPEIAEALTELFVETRQKKPYDEETSAQLDFLSKALGRLDAPGVVFPALEDAIETEENAELRKHALTSVAMIAGRAYERGAPLNDSTLTSAIIDVSHSGNSLDRHQAAFILGLIPSPEADARLDALVQDGDLMTRANAAVGLARNGSVRGLPVFEEAFADAIAQPLDPAVVQNDAQAQEIFERSILLRNCIKAVDVLRDELSADRRQRLLKLTTQLADATQDPKLKNQARELQFALAGE
ncbi:MAG: HEAT repeat domain-containing protein [Planctomycetota bacterium]|nr:MAG: HEAT repeat domain-containing protein [Planctomycetota bacterium]